MMPAAAPYNSDARRFFMPTGYQHPGYVASLAAFGEPVSLPRSQGFILRRKIPGTPYCDATGTYPLFCCQDWRGLSDDITELGSALVSVVLIADPFGGHDF